MKERAPRIPPYEHDKHAYYRFDNGYKFRPLDINNSRLVALDGDLVRKRELFRLGIAFLPQGEPPRKREEHYQTRGELTHVA